MNTKHIIMNDFKREYALLKKQLHETAGNVLKNGWYVLGGNVKKFEEAYAAYIGTRYCISVANGYDALYISLLALGIGPGDEVIVPANSFIATALPVSRVGAVPVFVDTDEYYHMDPTAVEKAITKKTKAIIPVHLYGQIVDMSALERIKKKYNLYLIEDACQAHGAMYKGKKAGAFGDLNCFSFYPTKNLGAFGDGGAIVTNSKKLYERCLKLRNYGQEVKYKHSTFGINSRLDEIQAALLLEKLPMLDTFIQKRNELASLYKKELQGISQILLPKTRAEHTHAYHLFVIQAKKRDALMEYLKERNIQSMIHYPIPIHKQEAYKEFNDHTFEKTESDVENILSLPLHPLMTKAEVISVCKAIKQFYKEQKTIKTLTVGIPAHNEEANIGNLITSIQQQRGDSFIIEKILINSDQSTDKTEKIVIEMAKKDPRIVLMKTKKRLGKCLNMNEIYAANRSEYLLTLDADVVFEDNTCIERLIHKMHEKKHTLVVGGNLTPILPEKTFKSKIFYSNHVIWNCIRRLLHNGNNIYNLSGQISLIKGDFVKKVQYPHGISCDEFYFYLRTLQEHPKGFAFAEDVRVLTYPPTTFSDFRKASSRNILERDLLVSYFGEDAMDAFIIDPNVKLRGVLHALKTIHPIYVLSSFIINLLIAHFPHHDPTITDGLWEPVTSTKLMVRTS